VADLLDEAARQVRLDNHDNSTVHDVAATWVDPQVGRTYRTYCCRVMTRAEGAILTTREATCGPCLRGGR
jgi:hypothetical protein